MIFLPSTQGCGSGLIQSGSGSSILAQSGSGYGSTKSLNPDPIWIRIRSGSTTVLEKTNFFKDLKMNMNMNMKWTY
jgi:hypothetical protein